MTVRAMYVTVGNFFLSRIAYTFNSRFEQYFHTGQRMVAVYYGFTVGNIGYTINQYIAGFRIIGFKHHADFNFNREHTYIFNAHQLRILLAESIIRRQSHFDGIAYIFTVQRFFHQRENTVITAMQISNRLFGFVQQLVVGIVHFIMQGNYGIFNNRHHAVLNRYLKVTLRLFYHSRNQTIGLL